MIYYIEYKELCDKSWILIKRRATTCPQKAIAAMREWCDQGKNFWADVQEIEEL